MISQFNHRLLGKIVSCLLIAGCPLTVLAAELPKRDSIVGQVVNAQGAPVENARVWAIPMGAIGSVTVTKSKPTSSDGRFELPRDSAWDDSLADQVQIGLVAFLKGKSVGGIAIQPDQKIQDLKITLPEPSEYSIRIVDPAGEPISNTRATLAGLHVQVVEPNLETNIASVVMLPAEVANQLETKTNADGVARFVVSDAQKISGVTVHSDQFGEQSKVALGAPAVVKDATFKLRKTAHLRVKITGPASVSVSGRQITVQTQDYDQRTSSLITGRHEIVTDESGEFEVQLPSGNASIFCRYSEGEKYHLTSDQRAIQLPAGANVDLQLKLKRGVRFHGQILDEKSSKPVVGIPIVVAGFAYFDFLETDESGKFETLVPPGTVTFRPFVSNEFAQPNVNPVVEVPETAEFELDTIRLARAAQLEGVTTDSHGQVLAGVSIHAKWRGQNRLSEKQVISDANGRFRIVGVEKDSEIRLAAELGDRSRVLVHQCDGKPVEIALSKGSRHFWKGRVVDVAGKPVTNVQVEVWSRPWMPTGFPVQSVRWQPETQISTNANGEFTVARIDEDAGYQVRIRGETIESTDSEWFRATNGRFSFPDQIVARRLDVVTGRVVDSQGQAVSSANVISLNGTSRQETTTDSNGQFSINASLGGFLLIQKEGFRFYGEWLNSESSQWTLVRISEPASPRKKRQIYNDSIDERRKVAATLLTEFLDKPSKTKLEKQLVARMLEKYASVNPDETLDHVENGHVDGIMKKAVLSKAVLQLAAQERVDEALEVIEADDDPRFRVQGLVWMTDQINGQDKGTKLQLLSRALIDAKALKMPGLRAIYLGQIAERLLDLDEVEQATKILREGQSVAEKLSTSAWSGYARGAFAEELVQIDFEAAVKLVSGLKDVSEFNRHVGNMAHELGAKRPDDAIRLLKMLKKGKPNEYISFDQYAVRVCYRMAKSDLAKAERLAEEIGYPENRAYAFGVMAVAIANSDRENAERLMRKGFRVLAESIDDSFHTATRPYRAGTIAACLLPLAEEISPDLISELFWQAISFQIALPDEENHSYWATESNASLAFGLANYDLQVAEKLFSQLAKSPTKYASRIYHLVPAVFGPERFQDHLETIQDADQRARVLVSALPILAAEPSSRIRHIHSSLGLWPIDVEDLGW